MSFLGSKAASGAYQALIAAMPPHDTYLEGFLGTGKILRTKPPAARSVGIEVDPDTLAKLWSTYDGEAELIEGDCLAFLRTFDYKAAGRVFVYLDPPYLLCTRTSRRRYRFEFSSATEHEELLRLVLGLPAMFMISGYRSDLYNDLLRGWRSIEFQVMSRGGPRTEVAWMNYDDQAVHWASFAGRDFTDRQRIRRKAARWAANYAELPAGERQAILAALLQVHAKPGRMDAGGDADAAIDAGDDAAASPATSMDAGRHGRPRLCRRRGPSELARR